ncbi:hypothetical protein [Dokdonia sp. Hel_I_53]|uniref:hypothetical protein n=1 Tax=Dokdonia sp. Hel_I_53 TaxID=1566287 RepID=UPI001198FC4C|nr:hypothetical protein [Dokdonia sp. Hel_I_53]TVZ50927.1 hypothetical protein OD90_0060 [Dokdonia sp. Hel_I_53]
MSQDQHVYYRERQPLTWLLSILIIVAIILGAIGYYDRLLGQFVLYLLYILLPITIIALLFYKLEIKITDKMAVASFGIGLIKRSISINELLPDKAEIINTPWIWGVGYRFTTKGVLLNASFNHALYVPTSSSSFFVGTRFPEKLLEKIKEAKLALHQ